MNVLGGRLVGGWRVLLSMMVLVVGGAVVLTALGTQLVARAPARENSALPFATSHPPMHVAYGQLPVIFEANQGQSDPQVKFLARGNGYGLFLTPQEAVLALQHSGAQDSVIRMRFAGANAAARVAGADELPGKSNYLIGNDPAKWHRNVAQFARVRYHDVYPGVDLVYYGRQGRLEYDFEVAPGADPGDIALQLDGPRALHIDGSGNLVLAAGNRQVEFEAPHVYQNAGGKQQTVEGKFVLRGDRVGFALGSYDHSRELIIDPALTYSSYLGGTGDESCTVITGGTAPPLGCPSIAVDAGFNVYIAGSTTSTDFPLVSGATPVQGTLNGTANLFIAKLNSTGSALTFSTYLGGSGVDTPAGVAVDNAFNVYVAGTTTSDDFPTDGALPGYQPTAKNTGTHVFVSKLDPTGATLLYSSYLSGTGTDTATGLALNSPQGDIHVTGTTTSTDFPTCDGKVVICPNNVIAFQPNSLATNKFFFSKLDPTVSGANSLLYSTYLGGQTPSTGTVTGGGIAVDANSNVYVTGATTFTDMGLNSAQSFTACNASSANCSHAIIGKFDLTQSATAQEKYLTYFGGSGNDIGTGIAVDSSSNAYVTGYTTSTDIAVISGTTPFQSANAGGKDAFLVKAGTPCTGTSCTTTAVPLIYFSYLGGTADDIGNAIAVDTTQGARITGSTASTDFPVVNAGTLQSAPGGGADDAFVTRIDTTAASATALGHVSSYLGGSGTDIGTGIAVDAQGGTYVTGETSSIDFPVLNPYQSTLNGGAGTDAFFSKYSPFANLSMTVAATPSPAGAGSGVTFTYTVTNNGDQVTGVTFTDFLPTSGASFTSASTSVGSCGTANGSTVGCSLGTLNASAIATVTIVITPSVGGTVSNSAQIAVPGSTFTATASTSTSVSSYTLSVSPASATVTAGVPATYTAALIPTGSFPNSITLSCSSGLPAATMCTVTNGNTVPNLTAGSQSRQLVINTTLRTTAGLWKHGAPFYASWLPVSGLALLGAGMGKKKARRKLLTIFLVLAVCGLLTFQFACGSSGSAATTTAGTPAGTYTINITATSGTLPYTQTVPVTLIVQ